MKEQQNIELVKQAYDAFSRADMPSLLNTLAENIRWTAPEIEGAPYSSNFEGRAATAEFFAKLDEAETFNRFEPLEFIAQGDKVVVLGTTEATVKSTNRSYQSDWAHVFTVRDGKVAEFQEYYDSAAITNAFRKAAATA